MVEIGAARIVVCGAQGEAAARARILLRTHGSPVAALQQALGDWRAGTAKGGVILVLLDRGADQTTAWHSLFTLAREAFHTARKRHDNALENALLFSLPPAKSFLARIFALRATLGARLPAGPEQPNGR